MYKDLMLPTSIPISLAAIICGFSQNAFRRHCLNAGAIARDELGRVRLDSLEIYLGHTITETEYLRADRRRDGARAAQRAYRRRAG